MKSTLEESGDKDQEKDAAGDLAKQQGQNQQQQQRQQHTVEAADADAAADINNGNGNDDDGQSSTSISLTTSMIREVESTTHPLHHRRSSLPLYTTVPRTLSSSSSSEHQQQYQLQARNTSTSSTAEHSSSNKRLKTAVSGADNSLLQHDDVAVKTATSTTTLTSGSQSTSTTNTTTDANVSTTTGGGGGGSGGGGGANNNNNTGDEEATNLSPPTPPPLCPPTTGAAGNSTPSLKPHPAPMMMVAADVATAASAPATTLASVTATTPASAPATPAMSSRRSSLSSGASGCWTDDEAYENLPKTPLAPAQKDSSASSSRTSLRQSSMSPIPGGSASSSSVGSNGLYLPEVPPAPPTTPHAAGAKSVMATIAMGSCATPLPYTGGFVQNAYQLEQQFQQRHNQKQQQQQQQVQQQQQQQNDQLLQNAGAATPAPPKPQQQQQQQTTSSKKTTATPTPTTFLSDDSSEWAVGDRYKLSRILGRGSYGEVAQAIDLYQGRPDAFVAIKRIVGPFEQEVDAVRLFREIHILRLLRTLGTNDCIVPLLDVVQPPTEDLNDFHDLYLVFDYVDTDLYKLIMSPQYLTTEHIQTFLYQMLIGLKYIHSCNVIHRDLKPANILLNEDCSLKICDFGLARIVDEISVAHSSSTKNAKFASIPSHSAAAAAAKKAAGRSCSISEQALTRDDNDGNHMPSMPSKTRLTRQLTKHVVTRWYRAPELILIQPYTTAVDIWSMGCIFAELLSMQEGSVPGYQDRTPLFPGGACYPLSGDTDNDERLDQLNVIFGVIGTPSKEEIAEVGNSNEYLKTLKPIKAKSLKDIYPAADPNALDLLHNMLKFNPKQRCTAGEALQHKFFSGVRREEMETSVDKPMESPAFLNEQDIDIEILKQKTYEEVLWFRDNNNINAVSNPPQEQPSTE